MNDEFVALSWLSILAVFAAGFMLEASIEDFIHGQSVAGNIFVTAMFLLIAKSGAQVKFRPGTYVRGWLTWTRKISDD